MSNYTVVKGDTLYAIATRFGLTVADLKALNGLKDNNLRIGQVLRVRATPASPPPPPPAPPPSAPPAPTASGTMGAGTTRYTVVRGDTLFSISRHFGVTVDAIKTRNNLASTNLSIGQVLQIPIVVHQPTTPPPTNPPTHHSTCQLTNRHKQAHCAPTLTQGPRANTSSHASSHTSSHI